MRAGMILISIALLMLVAAVWDDLKRGGRMTPARKTYLMVASIFALINAILQLFN